MSRFNMSVEQIIGIVKNLPDDQKRQVFRELAKEMRQKRQELMLAPGLAALWVGLVTPIPNRLAVPLVEGIVHSLVADTTRAQAIFPPSSRCRIGKQYGWRFYESRRIRWRPTGAALRTSYQPII